MLKWFSSLDPLPGLCPWFPLGDFRPSDHLLSTSQQNLTKSSTATNDVTNNFQLLPTHYVKLVETTTQRKGVTRMYSKEHKITHINTKIYRKPSIELAVSTLATFYPTPIFSWLLLTTSNSDFFSATVDHPSLMSSQMIYPSSLALFQHP